MKKVMSLLTTLILLSMILCAGVFAAGLDETPEETQNKAGDMVALASDLVVEYRGHIQNVGDYPFNHIWVEGPVRVGSEGLALRLESFWIRLRNKPDNVNITYQVHVQNIGWMDWVKNGELGGTQGQALQVEAVRIKLVDDAGNPVPGYSVTYAGHIENIGDTDWVRDGADIGTVGQYLRLEALRVLITSDKADLTAYYAALAAVKEEDYTPASWAEYQKVVDANVVTEDNTQEEVDQATANILAAQAFLVGLTRVSDVSILGSTQVLVSFTGPLQDAKLENFSVVDSVGNVIAIADLEMNPVKTAVTLTFVDPMLNATEYLLTTSGLFDENNEALAGSTHRFTYEKGDVASIEFVKTIIARKQNVKDLIKVTDTFGRDITKEVAITIVDSSKPRIIGLDGLADPFNEASLSSPEQSYSMVVASAGGVQTEQTRILIKDNTPESFVGYNIIDLADPQYAANTDEFEALPSEAIKHHIYAGESGKVGLALYYKDAFGRSLDVVRTPFLATDNVTLTNQNVVNVYASTDGVLHAGVAGKARIVVKYADIESTLLIDVHEDPVISSMELVEKEITVVEDAAYAVDVIFKDQYGIVRDVTPRADSKNVLVSGTSARPNTVIARGVSAGSTTLTVSPAHVSGSYTYKIAPGLSEELKVNVVARSAIASYEAVAASTDLDVGGIPDGNPTSTTRIDVNALDASGKSLGAISDALVVLEEVNASGNIMPDESSTYTERLLESVSATPTIVPHPVKAKRPGTAYLRVTINHPTLGTMVVDTLTLNIVDTRKAPISAVVDTRLVSIPVNLNNELNTFELHSGIMGPARAPAMNIIAWPDIEALALGVPPMDIGTMDDLEDLLKDDFDENTNFTYDRINVLDQSGNKIIIDKSELKLELELVNIENIVTDKNSEWTNPTWRTIQNNAGVPETWQVGYIVQTRLGPPPEYNFFATETGSMQIVVKSVLYDHNKDGFFTDPGTPNILEQQAVIPFEAKWDWDPTGNDWNYPDALEAVEDYESSTYINSVDTEAALKAFDTAHMLVVGTGEVANFSGSTENHQLKPGGLPFGPTRDALQKRVESEWANTATSLRVDSIEIDTTALAGQTLSSIPYTPLTGIESAVGGTGWGRDPGWPFPAEYIWTPDPNPPGPQIETLQIPLIAKNASGVDITTIVTSAPAYDTQRANGIVIENGVDAAAPGGYIADVLPSTFGTNQIDAFTQFTIHSAGPTPWAPKGLGLTIDYRNEFHADPFGDTHHPGGAAGPLAVWQPNLNDPVGKGATDDLPIPGFPAVVRLIQPSFGIIDSSPIVIPTRSTP